MKKRKYNPYEVWDVVSIILCGVLAGGVVFYFITNSPWVAGVVKGWIQG